MAVRKIQTKRRCICYTRKASKNEENLRTQAHDVESVRITRLDDGEKLRKREYSRELLSIYGEVFMKRVTVLLGAGATVEIGGIVSKDLTKKVIDKKQEYIDQQDKAVKICFLKKVADTLNFYWSVV